MPYLTPSSVTDCILHSFFLYPGRGICHQNENRHPPVLLLLQTRQVNAMQILEVKRVLHPRKQAFIRNVARMTEILACQKVPRCPNCRVRRLSPQGVQGSSIQRGREISVNCRIDIHIQGHPIHSLETSATNQIPRPKHLVHQTTPFSNPRSGHPALGFSQLSPQSQPENNNTGGVPKPNATKPQINVPKPSLMQSACGARKTHSMAWRNGYHGNMLP
ncbi:hypothetical protein BDZ45DRAFT_362646 [Acephala macrosclerotiorum]|nr:hypothetical protein BDZ45DRAFT_362646 [Acephala macrosclerotiorum]